MEAYCIKDYKTPSTFNDEVFDKEQKYTVNGIIELPNGEIDAMVTDYYGEKWGFVLNHSDKKDYMYVYNKDNDIKYIGTGKVFKDYFDIIKN